MTTTDYRFPLFGSVDDIREQVTSTGNTFFSEQTMRQFRCRVGSRLYGGRFFVTSEHGGQHVGRAYTVRIAFAYADTGNVAVQAVNEWGAYRNRSGAHDAAARLARQKTTPEQLATLVDPDREAITLGLLNRAEVIAFINGKFHQASEPGDLGSDVVYVDLIDRRAVVINGETVTRTADEFIVGRDGRVRDRFARVVTPEAATR